MPRSLRFLLLGIALILFGLAFPSIQNLLEYIMVASEFHINLTSRWAPGVVPAIFTIAGLILAFVGFFWRDKPDNAA